MGANIKVEGNIAIINGVERYTGARVSAPDLRAGAALVIAGLAADGITIVDDIYYIERGYEAFDEKFRGIGGMMQKVSSEKEIQQFRLKLQNVMCGDSEKISWLMLIRVMQEILPEFN